jgi:hypothetical protein
MTITAILQLLNLAIPAVTTVVMLLKNENGGTTAIISTTEAQNASDIAAAQAWIAAHQNPPAKPAA